MTDPNMSIRITPKGAAGIIELDGNTALGVGRSLTFAAESSGTFTTGTGLVSLRGNTEIATDRTFIQNGGGTFSTGTGLVSLRGNTRISELMTFGYNSNNSIFTGHTINQEDSKTADVTLDRPWGRVNTATGTIPGNDFVSFTFYNSYIGINDMLIITQGGSGLDNVPPTSYYVNAHVNTAIAGRAVIGIRNLLSTTSPSHRIPIRFMVLKFAA